MSEKFCSVELEKDGEEQLDRSCEKLRRIAYSQGGEEYPTYKGGGGKKEG